MEYDLAVSLSEDECLNLKKFNLSCSHNIAIRENRFKKLYRWRCQANNADFMHIWWNCGKLKGVWRQVYVIIKRMLEIELPWIPRVMLLADLAGTEIGSKKNVVANMLTAASMLTAGKWKTQDIWTITEWFIKVRIVRLLAKLLAICRYRDGNVDALTTFVQQWGPLMHFKNPGFSQLNRHAEVLALL